MKQVRFSMVKGFHCRGNSGEKVLINGHSNPQNLQDEIGVAVTFVALLKACANQKDLHKGSTLHTDIAKRGLLEKNVFVGSALVNMYAKCGALERAQEVFDELPIRNVVSWNALIAGYAQHGCGEEALKSFEQMQVGGFTPNTVTFACILKACGSLRALYKGQEIHAHIANERLLEKDIVVASALVDMYVKCGALEKAQEVFDELPIRNTVSWTALIAGYVQHGRCEEALNGFEQMQRGGFSPNTVTFACILKACGSLGSVDKGQEIHAQIVREQLLEKSIVVANALIDMYAKCGSLEKAQEVFDMLTVRNVVSWTVLIAGYAQQGYGERALTCFKHMQSSGFLPDAVTFACVLKACGSTKDVEKGKEIHAQIVRNRMLEKDVIIASALIDMYAKCGALEKAQEVFDELPFRDIVLWNVLITGYAQHGQYKEALLCFEQMRHGGFLPNATTFACIIKACGIIGALGKAQGMHAQVVRNCLLETHTVVANALVDMYAQCGALRKAQQVFDELLACDIVSWNVLIAGYAQHGHGKEALNCFEQMQLGGFSPNAVTFACILKACGSVGALDKGEEVHAQVVRESLLQKDIVIANGLVDMYAKCGAHEKAQELLHEMPFQDIVSWNALIAGCAQHGQDEEALNYFQQMQLQGFTPDEVTFACILKACGSRGAAYEGQEIHDKVVRYGLLQASTVLGTALVVMYANCGMLAEAQELFDKLPDRDVVSWSALMAGHAVLGKDEAAINLFNSMVENGIEPNLVTFTIVLKACKRRGLVDKGQMYFEIMREGYGIIPTLEHYTCMVDLLGCAGHLGKAVAVIEKMPLCADLTLWHTLLDACKKWGNTKLGRWAFEHIVQLEERRLPQRSPVDLQYSSNP